MRNTIKNKKGFSLIEFVVVVAIIALMIGFTLPSYYNYKTKELQKDQEVHREAIERSIKQCIAFEGTLYQKLDASGNPVTTGTDSLQYYSDKYNVVLNSTLYEYGFQVTNVQKTEYILTVKLKALDSR